MKPTVFYDGGCPVCRREIDYYRRLDRHASINWCNIDAAPEAVEGSGVTWEQAMARLHVMDRDGRLRSGAEAFTVIWDELPGWRWLSRSLRALGLLRPLDWTYGCWLRLRPARRCEVGGRQPR